MLINIVSYISLLINLLLIKIEVKSLYGTEFALSNNDSQSFHY